MNKRKIGLLCGSFDPFTYGHVDLTVKAFEYVDMLFINVGKNSSKDSIFSPKERVEMILKALQNHPRKKDITVMTEDGMTVDIAFSCDANVLIRGIRPNTEDEANERKLAMVNKQLAMVRGFDLETVIIEQKDEELAHVSSTVVRNLCKMQEYITAFKYVPDCVAEKLAEYYLKPIWTSLFLKGNSCVNESWEELIAAYRGRAYHNLTHVAYMLNMLKVYKAYTGDELKTSEKDILLAIFTHDVVYDVYALEGENEQESSLFIDRIGAWLALDINPREAMSMVMSTAQASDKLGVSLVRDLDLAILATSDICMWYKYCKGIREEYKNIPEQEYNAKRIEFLQSMLKKQIFHIAFFFNKFEEKAKENLQKEIDFLQKK